MPPVQEIWLSDLADYIIVILLAVKWCFKQQQNYRILSNGSGK